MTDLKTFIIVKNISLEIIERLIKNEIVKKELLKKDEIILVKMKNSRLFLLIFPNLITKPTFNILYKTLASFTENLVSPSEIVAVYNSEFEYLKSDLITSNFSVSQIFSVYKLNKSPLHVMLNINKISYPDKKWWQFWEN